MNKIDLEGRAAIITGAARGIGYAIAKRLLESGATVFIWDIDAEQREKAVASLSEKGKVYSIAVDLTRPEGVENAFQETLDRTDHIDILINNAGIAGPNATTWEYPVKDWQRVLDINLNGVFYCCRTVAPRMISQNYGRVVNIASIAGKEGNPNAVAYSAAKAGVIALTKSLGKELAENNISVNCVTPAAAKTDIFKQMNQEHIDYMLSKIPRKRFVLMEEIAAMVTWLASEENSFTTAGVFDISGGRATY